jgi:hypothetical protein
MGHAVKDDLDFGLADRLVAGLPVIDGRLSVGGAGSRWAAGEGRAPRDG